MLAALVALAVLAWAGFARDVAPPEAWHEAQRHLAEAHPAEALYWMQRAARLGYADAQRALGDAYRTGQLRDTAGTPRGSLAPRADEAARWYRAAADAYRIAATRDVAALVPLGDLHAHGWGVEADAARARAYWEAAALQGVAEAQHRLASASFERGAYAAAVRWARRAARQEHAAAQSLLAFLHQDGYGVPVRRDSARYWLHRAAANGDRSAAFQLQALEQMTPPDAMP